MSKFKKKIKLKDNKLKIKSKYKNKDFNIKIKKDLDINIEDVINTITPLFIPNQEVKEIEEKEED